MLLRIDSPIDKKNQLKWHQDSGYFRQNKNGYNGINCWAPLTNLKFEMGPLEFLAKSHKNGLYKVRIKQKTLFHRSGKINQITEYLSPILLNMLLKKIPNSMFELFPEMNELLQKKPIKKKPKKKINQINKLIWFK